MIRSQPPPPLPFTREESAAAHRLWLATCGPHSIAAAAGKSLDEVRFGIPNYKGWMSPTQVTATLRALGIRFTLTSGLKTRTLCEGVSRIQFEGPWLNPGRPPVAAYAHTHYVARRGSGVLCTATYPDDWFIVDAWEMEGPAPYDEDWHVTHHWEF